MKPCDENLQKAISLTYRMMELADKGDAEREDSGCGVLYGVMRDSAYKIKQLAEKEKLKHNKKITFTV